MDKDPKILLTEINKLSEDLLKHFNKNVISEVVRTGHDDSLSRRMRKTIKGKRHLKGDDSRSHPMPDKRGQAKLGRKSNNNKPKKLKNKVLVDTSKIPSVHREAVEFLIANEGKPITIESIRTVNDKLALQNVVNRMIAYHLNNWSNVDDKITNGVIDISQKLWVVKEGLLYNRATGERPANFDWLFDLKTVLESTIIEDIVTIKDTINGRKES